MPTATRSGCGCGRRGSEFLHGGNDAFRVLGTAGHLAQPPPQPGRPVMPGEIRDMQAHLPGATHAHSRCSDSGGS
jgi:hypothetical protein